MPPCSTLTNTFQGDKSGLSSLLSPSFKVWQRHVRNLFNTPKITYLVSILCNSTTSLWLKSWTITTKEIWMPDVAFLFIMVRYLETENWVKNHFLACNNNLHKPTEQWIHWCRAQRVEPVTSQALLQKPLLTMLRPCSLLAIPHWLEMLTLPTCCQAQRETPHRPRMPKDTPSIKAYAYRSLWSPPGALKGSQWEERRRV